MSLTQEKIQTETQGDRTLEDLMGKVKAVDVIIPEWATGALSLRSGKPTKPSLWSRCNIVVGFTRNCIGKRLPAVPVELSTHFEVTICDLEVNGTGNAPSLTPSWDKVWQGFSVSSTAPKPFR